MKIRILAASAVVLAAGAPAAHAGVYGDDLAKCVVASTSPQDQKTFVTWMFSAMALHPDVRPFATISESQTASFAGQAGKLMQRLLVEDCRKQAVTAIKYEGPAVLEESFRLLGEVAMRGLMSAPEVEAGLSHLEDGVDKAKFDALGAEAGLKPPAATK